jgi:hypothetical protein
MVQKLLSFSRRTLLLLMLGPAAGWAQVITNYSPPAATIGTYTALSGTTSPLSGGTPDDGWFNTLPIGFPFVYMGRTYTTASASTNGWLTLGQSISNATAGNALASGGTRPVLAPLWDDLDLVSATNFSYQTTGSSGSRVFTAEWKSVKWYYNTSSLISFQVRLSEATGAVQFSYSPDNATSPGGSATASVGIAGLATGSGNFLSLNSLGTSPAVSSTTESASIGAKPAAGQTYTFTPPAAVPAAPSGLVISGVSYNSLAVSFTDNATTEVGYSVYALNTTTGLVDAVQNLSALAGSGTTPASPVTLSGLTSGVTYTVVVTANSEGRGAAISGSQATLPPVAFSGTAYTIDNSQQTSGTNFNNFTDAFAALNAGSIAGNTTIGVKYNSATPTYDEAPLTLTQTGTSSATLTFVSAAGNTANPVVRGISGVGSTDAVITLMGVAYTTFDGINLSDNATTANGTRMERGLYLAASAATGCNNVTFRNASIALNTANTNATAAVYSLANPTSTALANSNLLFQNLTVQNAQVGYSLNNGTTNAAFYDQNNRITGTAVLPVALTSTIGNMSGAATAGTIGVSYSGQAGLLVSNTSFGGLTATAGPVYGVVAAGGSANTVTVSGNTFTNLVTSASAPTPTILAAGINIANGSTAQINGNVFTASGTSAASVAVTAVNTSSYSAFGITQTSGRADIYDNTVAAVRQTNAAGSGNTLVLCGIRATAASTTTTNVYRNNINTVVHATGGVGGATSGLWVASSAGTANVYNNFISNIRNDAGSGTPVTRGLQVDGATTAANVYYNSVYLSSVGAGTIPTGHQSAALYITSSAGLVDYRNNILVNRYQLAAAPSASSAAFAIYRTGSGSGTFNAAINNNLVQGNGAIYYDGNNKQVSLASYKTAINVPAGGGARETAAVTETTTPFAGPTDPHLTTATATQAESGAQRLTGPSQSGVAVPDDYDTNPRQGETGYTGPGTAPDIGADEGNFTPLDVTAPVITIGTPLPGTTSATAPTLTNVTITDASGVSVAAGTAPRLYYKLSTDANTYNDNTSATLGFKYVEASGTASPFSFVLDYSKLPGNVSGALPAGTTVQYFVVAQDNAPTPNVGINAPNTFAAPPAGVALTAAAFPIGGTLNSYLIQESFGGTVSVGPGQVYNGQPLVSLTAAGGLFARLNAGALTGNLTVLITGDLTVEDGTTVLRPPSEAGAGGYSISIQPDAATERLITGAGGSMGGGIRLTGADRVTFDGRFNQTGTAKYLRLRNASTANGVLLLEQDATNNTIRNCYIESGATGFSVGAVTFFNSSTAVTNGVAAGTTGNDSNALLECDVLPVSGGSLDQGFYSSIPSVTAASNSDNTVTGNNFVNIRTYGLTTATGTGSNWTISNNSFYQTAASTSNAQWAMNLSAQSSSATTGWLVSGNYIGGSAPQAGGTPWVNSAAVAFRGIYLNGLGTSTSTPAVLVQNNTVANVQLTGAASTFAGIETKASDATSYQILGNTIENVSGAGTGTSGLSTPVVTGILAASTSSSVTAGTAQLISGNVVRNLALTGTGVGNLWVAGIVVKGTAPANGLLTRNRVYGFTSAGATGAAGGPVGILVANGDWNVANNQVSFLAPSPTGANIRAYGIIDNVGSTIRTVNVYFNSVVLAGTSAAGTQKTYAFQRSSSVGTLRNNIFLNLRTGGTGGNFAIGTSNLTTFTSNPNDLYAAEAAKLGEVGSTAYAFAGWKTATSQDADSKNTDVKFVDPATGNLNLDPTTNCQLDNAGQAIAGINGEFDNATTSRQTTPDLGADEFSSVPQAAALASTTAQTVCPGGTGTLTLSLAGNGGPFTVTYIDGTTPTVLNNATTGQTIAVPLVGSATTYTLVSATDAYGCALNVTPGSNSLTLNEATSTTWNGSASTDWFAAANWTNCVPTSTMDALIPAGLTSYPSLNTAATAEVRTLTLANGAGLSQSAGTLNVYGNLTSNTPAASLSLTGGTVAFRGAAPTMAGVASLTSLAVNLNSPTGTLTLANDLTATGAVALTQGVLNTGGFTLALTVGATLAESNASYVLGRVAAPGRSLSTATAESFGGIGLTLTPDAASTAFPGLTPVVRTTGTALTGAGTSVSITRYFDIQPAVNTGLNVTMDFSYFTHELNGIPAANLALFKSVTTTAGPWANQSTTSVAGTTVTKTGIADFSIWTLGNAANPLPVELTAFTATRASADAVLNWATASEKNSRGFEVQVSTDGRGYRPLGFVASPTAASTVLREYTYRDREAGKTGLRYYRLRQLDLDGTASFSPVRMLRFEGESTLTFTAAPNPFQERLILTVELPASATAAEISLTDAAGRTLLKQVTPALPAGSNQLELSNLSKLASGVYFVRFALPGQAPQHLKVTKE